MKIQKVIILLFFSLSTVLLHAQYDSIAHGGLQRTYQLHLPIGYTGDEDLPLVIAMHGGFGSGTQLENQSQLSVKADEENFIVVYPEGVKSLLNIRTWNAGNCCGYAVSNDIDDVGFINALLDSLISTYSIDTSRVYATGMSNGGFMSYRLACELSNRIAAIAPVAASMAIDECNPISPVPIIHFHSYQDSNVPYDGGYGDGISDHYNPPLDSVLNAWSLVNDCEITNDTLVNDSAYTHVIWNNCDCSSSIEYYITADGGHSWPGGTTTVIGDPVSQVINANDLMWEFFEDYDLECEELLHIEEDQLSQNLIKVYPNPTTGTFVLVGDRLRQVIVYNNEGKEVFEIKMLPSDMLNINLSGEAIGHYFLKVFFADDKKEMLQVVLQ